MSGAKAAEWAAKWVQGQAGCRQCVTGPSYAAATFQQVTVMHPDRIETPNSRNGRQARTVDPGAADDIQRAEIRTPVFSSPWAALFGHFRANRNGSAPGRS